MSRPVDTEIARLAAELQRGRQVFEAVFHATLIGKALVDLTGHCIEVNESLAEMLGFTPAELAGVHFAAFTHPDDVDTDLHLFESVVRGERDGYQLEKRYIRRDGSALQILLCVAAARDEERRPIQLVAEILDMTQYRRVRDDLQEANGKLRELVVTDHLTGLLNKRGFEEALAVSIERETASIMLIDIDNFKTINDTLGHETGDLILSEFGHRLAQVVRDQDIVARVGGDEFGVIMHGSGRDFATGVADRIVRHLNANYAIRDEQVAVGASAGLACVDGAARTLRELMVEADQALYAAKRAGRGRWCVAQHEAAQD